MFSGNHLFNNPMWHNGPRPGAFYDFPSKSVVDVTSSDDDFGRKQSAYAITTGTSVIGLKFNDGVIIAADTLISYGSLARYRNVDRVFRVNNNTIIGVGGDYADFQFIKQYIDQKVAEDYCYDDNIELKPKSLYNWLTRVLYNKRSRFEPLWIDIIVGGIQDGEPFLGHVDMRGRAYEDSSVATGYGKHLAVPYLREQASRKEAEGILIENIAKSIVKKSMEILYYRDCRTVSLYTQAICKINEKAKVEGPISVAENWKFAESVTGYS